jgi:cysteinyl-tRNA synthetase
MDQVLGLDLEKCDEKLQQFKQEETVSELSEEIISLGEQRKQARKEKNWALSDQLRDELKAKGYLVEDTKEGQQIKPIG